MVPAPSYDVGMADVSGRAKQENARTMRALENMLGNWSSPEIGGIIKLGVWDAHGKIERRRDERKKGVEVVIYSQQQRKTEPRLALDQPEALFIYSPKILDRIILSTVWPKIGTVEGKWRGVEIRGR